MTITTRTRLIAAACAVGLTAAGVTACSNDSDVENAASSATAAADKAADKAGEAAEKAAEAATEAAKDAATDAKKAADKAAKEADEATDKAADAAKEAGKDAKDAADHAAEEAKEAADKAGDAAEDAAKDAGKAADKAGDEVKDAAKDATTEVKDAVAEADGDKMVTVKDQAGTEIKVPDAIKVAYEKLGGDTGPTGALVNVTEKDGKWVASYANGWHIAFSKKTGAYPVKGLIGKLWFENGAISNEIGMPTAPEHPKSDGGWIQDFTNGQLWAGKNGDVGALEASK